MGTGNRNNAPNRKQRERKSEQKNQQKAPNRKEKPQKNTSRDPRRSDAQVDKAHRQKNSKPFFIRVLEGFHGTVARISKDFKETIRMIKHPEKHRNVPREEMLRRFSIMGMISLIMISIISITIYGVYWGFTHKNGQEISINGEVLSLIWDTEITPEEIIKTVESKIKADIKTNIQLQDVITLEAVHTKKKETVTIDALISTLSRNLKYLVEGYEVTVDGMELAIIDDKTGAEALLKTIIEPYLQENLNMVESGFLEVIEFQPLFVEKKDIETLEALHQKLVTSISAEEVYEVVMGDSLESIAFKAGMSLEELLRLNPNTSVEIFLQIGDQLILEVEKPFITVITKEQVEYTAVIEKTIERKENSEKYLNYSRVLQQGKDGQEKVQAEIVRENGFEVEKNILFSEVLLEPITEIIEVGTGRVPPKKALGVFRMPTWGRVTEYFEARGGVHQGVDVANDTGTQVKASDGGIVLEAGWNNGYGKCLLIDHENGFITRYAHLSEILVAVGDRVAQSETIGKMGSTGRSTGSHLHFEMLKNNELVNPFSYID